MPKANDELPYEELDPCCQREVDNNRRNARITSELRQYDRSNHRLDLKKAVMGNLRLKSSCACCTSTTLMDYPLLVATREKIKMGNKTLDISNEVKDSGDDGIGDGESSEEEDEFDALLNEAMTPYEMERFHAVQEMKSRVELAQSMGYGLHREDTVDHLLDMIVSENERVVCHVFDPSSLSCAYMDVILEDLAQKYLGTRFRRIPQSSLSRLQTKFPLSSQHTSLLCFIDGSLEHFSSIDTFGAGSDIYIHDVEKFLDHAHVLSDEVVVPNCPGNAEDEEVDDGERYCDEPGCLRRFAHEHVGSSFSFLSSSEALPPNRLQSL